MREWGAKLAGNMLRIAGILALCDGVPGINEQRESDERHKINGQREISAEAVERAIAIADWYAEGAERLFIKKRRHSSDAHQVYEVLAANGGAMAKTALSQKTHKTGGTLQRALDELIKAGAVSVESAQTGGRAKTLVRLAGNRQNP